MIGPGVSHQNEMTTPNAAPLPEFRRLIYPYA